VTPRRKFWGWGYEGSGLDADEFRALAALLEARLGVHASNPAEPPRVEELKLRRPRIAAPAPLEALCTDDPHERAGHTYGKSYRDLVRALRREFPEPPDLVALPESEDDVAAILDWCTGSRIAVIPYGGGSSVVGGVEPDVGDDFAGAVSLDLRRLGRVLHVDERSRAAEVEAGVLGPALEEQLQPHGLTFRHFPQSFEFSTLGGWIATRSGGHYATGPTHVDEQVEALTVLTPAGRLETRRLPAGGAGPAPERLFCGSEGALGVITRAWIRLQERTAFRAGASVLFDRFEDAVEATRAVARSSLRPANCRLLDPAEALLSGSGDGTSAILVLGFESADRAVDAELAHAVELCRAHGGAGHGEAAAATWRSAFLRLPYVYEGLVRMGMLAGSVETAVTWDRFEQLHAGVTAALEEAGRAACGKVLVACRLAYVYPDGPAPYYTFVAPARAGMELEQWDAIKSAVSRAILDNGGTITHHHAVGRDHRPWYDEERPELFAEALRAAKRTLDPGGILNPGVLLGG
jgi:alkyldihydroxyacetonephosphate synthase